jgi:hypothetical protein
MEAKMFVRLTMFAVVALALALAVGGQANATPTSYGTYYDEDTMPASCSNTTDCAVYFSALPSNQLLMLEKVNCSIITSQPIIQVYVTISQTSHGDAFGRGVFVNPGPAVAGTNGNYNYTFQSDARLLIGQGRYPFVFTLTQNNSTSISMNCGIEGELVTPQ